MTLTPTVRHLRMRTRGISRLLDRVLSVLDDASAPLDDRAAAFAVTQQVKLRLDRALKAARDQIIVDMERANLRELGPLSIKATAVDPVYVVNDEANWGDSQVQDALAQLAGDPLYREYVRKVPAHMELDVAALTEAMRLGSRSARTLFGEMNRRGWRREVARRLSLAVREAKPPKAKEAA